MSAGLFDYTVAGSAAWFDADVFNSPTVPGQAAGWFDFDYLQPPLAPQILYYLQGGGDPWIFDPVTENFKDPAGLYKLAVPWQVVDEFHVPWQAGEVTWDAFQNKIVVDQKRHDGLQEFRRTTQELIYQEKYGSIIPTTIKVAGFIYIVWRLLG